MNMNEQAEGIILQYFSFALIPPLYLAAEVRPIVFLQYTSALLQIDTDRNNQYHPPTQRSAANTL